MVMPLLLSIIRMIIFEDYRFSILYKIRYADNDEREIVVGVFIMSG